VSEECREREDSSRNGTLVLPKDLTLYQLPFSDLWKREAEMRISLQANVYRRPEKVVCVSLTRPDRTGPQ